MNSEDNQLDFMLHVTCLISTLAKSAWMYFHRKSKTRFITTDLLWNIWFLKIGKGPYIFNEHWTVKILLIYDGDIILLLHGSLHYNARQFITLLKHSWERKLVVKGLNSRNPLTPHPILCRPSVQFDYSHPPWTIRTMIPQYLMSEHFVNQFASIFSFHRWSLPQRTSTRP